MDKIGIVEISDKEHEENINEAEKVLNSLTSNIEKIDKIFNKLNPSTRFFVCDALIGTILNSARLPNYLLSASTSKYFVMGQLTYLPNKDSDNQEHTHTSYLG